MIVACCSAANAESRRCNKRRCHDDDEFDVAAAATKRYSATGVVWSATASVQPGGRDVTYAASVDSTINTKSSALRTLLTPASNVSTRFDDDRAADDDDDDKDDLPFWRILDLFSFVLPLIRRHNFRCTGRLERRSSRSAQL